MPPKKNRRKQFMQQLNKEKHGKKGASAIVRADAKRRSDARTPLALGSGSGGPSSPSPSSPSLLALRPLPPAAPSGFTCSLRFDSVVEMLYDDGWWLGTVLALVKPGAQEPIGAGIPQLDDGALVEGPHLRRLRRPLLHTEGRNSSSSLPPLSLKRYSLRLRLRVLVGNGGGRPPVVILINDMAFAAL